MNETDIRKACAALGDAIECNNTADAKRLSIQLATQVLVDLNNISYQLSQIEMTLRNR